MRAPNSDAVYAALEREFGGPVHGWPHPDVPGNFHWSKTRINRALATVGLLNIDTDFARRFREEVGFGQLDGRGRLPLAVLVRRLAGANEFLDRYGRGCAPQAPTSVPMAAFDIAGAIRLKWAMSRAEPSIVEPTEHHGFWFGGHYHVGRTGKIWGAGTFDGRGGARHVGYFRSLAQAKAAAHSDLDARLREALAASAAQEAA